MKKSLLGLGSFLGMFSFYLLIAITAQAEIQNKEINECVANFDMNRVNFHKPPYTKNTYVLLKYFLCRGAAFDDVNECSNLINPEECKSIFTTYWVYYGRLVREGRLTKEIMDACEKTAQSKKDSQGCRALGELILKQDPSLCEKEDRADNGFCRAISNLDPSLSSSVYTKNIVYFIKALKTKNKDLCENIKDVRFKWLCIGGAKQDQRACETCEEIKEYKKNTCIEDIKIKKSYGPGGNFGGLKK